MLSTNLLWQAGIPCFSCKWGCSNTDRDSCGVGGPHRCCCDPQVCGYPPVHPTPELPWCPTSAARASPGLGTPAGWPALPATTFLGRCTKRFGSLLFRGQPSPRLCPWQAEDRPRALCPSPLLHRQSPPQHTQPRCPDVVPALRRLPMEGKLGIQSARPARAAREVRDAGGRRGGGAASALPLRHVALRFQREGDVSDYRANNSEQRCLNTSNYRCCSAGRGRCENANTGRAERSLPGKAVGAL